MKHKQNSGLRKSKRGSLQDLIFIGVVLLVFGISIVIGFKISSEFNANIQADSRFPIESKSAASTLTNYYPGVIDNSFLFLAVGISIATLILAALVRIHPVFLVFFIIGWIFIIFLSGVFSNIYETMCLDTNLVAQCAELTNVAFIMKGLPLFIGVVGVLLMIVMYKVWGIE